VFKVWAWPTSSLAALGDKFIAAPISTEVRANPVIDAYPGSVESASSASAVRCHNNPATADRRRAISIDSSRRQSSITGAGHPATYPGGIQGVGGLSPSDPTV
jgi:hypothetical protein